MTLRDLTPKQIENNVKLSNEKQKYWASRMKGQTREPNEEAIWNVAFNAGFVAGLAIPRKEE